MPSETHADRYCRQAAECELKAEKATNDTDRLAWQRLAEDWTNLARGAVATPSLEAEKPEAQQLAKSVNSN
jgi:hypothetical protein